MRLLKVAALSTAALCAAVFLFVLATLPPKARALDVSPAAARQVVAGAYHVHTRRSDGTGTADEVAAAAARAGLDFVIVTDHGDASRPLDPPTYRSGVLCLEGVEVSTWQGHYAVFGIRPPGYPLGGEPRDVVEDVARLGGFGVAAHPESPKPALQWKEWDAPVDALEWLNADSEWRGTSRLRLGHTLFAYLFRAPESVVSAFNRPEASLARWDEVTRRRRVVGIAGLDAHARIGVSTAEPYTGEAAFKVPSYEAMFRAFATRVQLDRPFTGRAGIDAMTLRSALADGHLYTAIDALAGPPSFDFSARSGLFSARQGDDLTLGGPIEIEAHANAPDATVVLFANGRVVAESRGRLQHRAEPVAAVFRVEVRLPSAPGEPPIPWIVSNPVYAGGIVDPRPPVVRAEAGESAPVTSQPGDWSMEREPRSQGHITSSGPGAVTLDYTLGNGPASGQYIAIAHRASGVGTWDRLQLRARAAHPMRVSVQLRTPAAPDGARWQRSVYLDEAPRDITVFLDDVRPIGPAPTARPDLAGIDTLLFVVDTTNAHPGTSGWVEFSEVRWSRPATSSPSAGGTPRPR